MCGRDPGGGEGSVSKAFSKILCMPFSKASCCYKKKIKCNRQGILRDMGEKRSLLACLKTSFQK